jgi:hypothetical protein
VVIPTVSHLLWMGSKYGVRANCCTNLRDRRKDLSCTVLHLSIEYWAFRPNSKQQPQRGRLGEFIRLLVVTASSNDELPSVRRPDFGSAHGDATVDPSGSSFDHIIVITKLHTMP